MQEQRERAKLEEKAGKAPPQAPPQAVPVERPAALGEALLDKEKHDWEASYVIEEAKQEVRSGQTLNHTPLARSALQHSGLEV